MSNIAPVVDVKGDESGVKKDDGAKQGYANAGHEPWEPALHRVPEWGIPMPRER